MIRIPGYFITWITFPGVIVHEFAHALFCRLFGVKIYGIVYFRLTTSSKELAGYVAHERTDKAWKQVLISIGPLFVNTIIGAVIAAPAAIPVLRFQGGDALDYFLIWLGVSICMHSFPSILDAKAIWNRLRSGNCPILTRVIGTPIVGLMYVGALGSMMCLDLLYGAAVAGFLPNLLVQILA